MFAIRTPSSLVLQTPAHSSWICIHECRCWCLDCSSSREWLSKQVADLFFFAAAGAATAVLTVKCVFVSARILHDCFHPAGVPLTGLPFQAGFPPGIRPVLVISDPVQLWKFEISPVTAGDAECRVADCCGLCRSCDAPRLQTVLMFPLLCPHSPHGATVACGSFCLQGPLRTASQSININLYSSTRVTSDSQARVGLD